MRKKQEIAKEQEELEKREKGEDKLYGLNEREKIIDDYKEQDLGESKEDRHSNLNMENCEGENDNPDYDTEIKMELYLDATSEKNYYI